MSDEMWTEVRRKGRNRSNEDVVARLSTSVFISNIPDSILAKDLFHACKQYGHVVDSFIPFKRDKNGNRFGFVRFLNVFNSERLVNNLCTVWIDRYKINAKIAQYQRNTSFVVNSGSNTRKTNFVAKSGSISRSKGNPTPKVILKSNGMDKEDNLYVGKAKQSTLVLDDECLVNRVLDNCVMGALLQFSAINNLQVILYNEGFHDVRIVYLGGLWVMIELNSSKSKAKFLEHVGVASWFSKLCNAQADFVAKERIAWVDIEGIPLNAWSRLTFQKIASKWGTLVDLEEGNDNLFARKRICVMTSHVENILDSFKIVVKGKIFWVRAKELFVWSPSLKEVSVNDAHSDDGSIKVNEDINGETNGDEESDNEVVSDTYFGDNGEEHGDVHFQEESKNSPDPFNIYGLLDKRSNIVRPSVSDSSIPYPPGFTPLEDDQVIHSAPLTTSKRHPTKPLRSTSRVLEVSDEVGIIDNGSSDSIDKGFKPKEGGSILELLEEMITVGQTMGFSMEGCTKDMEKIIGSQGEQKDHHTISDNFVALYGTWTPNNLKLLIISVYAPQSSSSKRTLWNYLASLISSWNGESLIMGDFNEVRSSEERWGSCFNVQGAAVFNSFISNMGLLDLQLEGYSFTWAHPSATKMSKLDRFLVSNGFISAFPHISALCLDRHLSDHRPILLKEIISDYGPTPFRFYHSWIELPGFEDMISKAWNSFSLFDSNAKKQQVGLSHDLKAKLCGIDKELDQGGASDDILLSRMETMKQLHEIQSSRNRDLIQKAKVRWAIEGDENSKYFHAIINKKRTNLSVKGIMVDGDWIVDPSLVKQEFRDHFAERFLDPGPRKGNLDFPFPNRLNDDQVSELEAPVSNDEIRAAVWGCGVDKSPGPDGFTFDFFRKFWTVIGPDFCIAVKWFFDHGNFATGCNSSFVTLIPKVVDPKLVSDYHPISLIGSLYKVVTKILASRLSLVISDLISDVQSAFLPNRQILDGPFIINEILARCKAKKQQAMIFKVDFAKAYDSIRWDFLDDVLTSFGFGSTWRTWIRGSLSSGRASILVNGSPTSEFQFFRGLKQGDPLAPFLFLLIMEAFHLSFSRATVAGIFKGLKIDSSLSLSHLFFADDAVFIGEWSQENLRGIMHILRCFSLLSGMSINILKSNLLGIGVADNCVVEAANSMGCSIMRTPFRYLGILVGDNMSSKKTWDETIIKMRKRLSKWKINTLSIGGRLTLLKSVLGSTPIYNLAIFKAPKSVLYAMESIRSRFFNGAKEGDRKISWIKWHSVLAAKEHGGLGVSSFYALNRALLFKWFWRFLSRDNSLWFKVVSAIHGTNVHHLTTAYKSTWSIIIKELNLLKDKGIDLKAHCKIRVGNGNRTSFWNDHWIGDSILKFSFPRLYALEDNKSISVAEKISGSISSSFRRDVRGGVENYQLDQIKVLLDQVMLSNMADRWYWDLNGEGIFRVKDARKLIDESFLPKGVKPTRWVKSVPNKVNVFAWKLCLDRLPTRSNLARRNVFIPSLVCPLCDQGVEDASHLFFGCSVAKDVMKLICRWWDLDYHLVESYEEWLAWFKSIRLGAKTKDILEVRDSESEQSAPDGDA
ncbi:RNA-directed DNA polymerase, eukaryota [Tanacetum coccineum]